MRIVLMLVVFSWSWCGASADSAFLISPNASGSLFECVANVIKDIPELSCGQFRACRGQPQASSLDEHAYVRAVQELHGVYCKALSRHGVVKSLQDPTQVHSAFIFAFRPTHFSGDQQVVLKIANPYISAVRHALHWDGGLGGANAALNRNVERVKRAARIRANAGGSKITAPLKMLAWRQGADGASGGPVSDETTVVVAEYIASRSGADGRARGISLTDQDAEKLLQALLTTGSFDFHEHNIVEGEDGKLYLIDLETPHKEPLRGPIGPRLASLIKSASSQRCGDREPLLDALVRHVFTSPSFSGADRLSLLWQWLCPTIRYPLPFACNGAQSLAYGGPPVSLTGFDFREGPRDILIRLLAAPISHEERSADEALSFRYECLCMWAVRSLNGQDQRPDLSNALEPAAQLEAYIEQPGADRGCLTQFFKFFQKLVFVEKWEKSDLLRLLNAAPWNTFCKSFDPSFLYVIRDQQYSLLKGESFATAQCFGYSDAPQVWQSITMYLVCEAGWQPNALLSTPSWDDRPFELMPLPAPGPAAQVQGSTEQAMRVDSALLDVDDCAALLSNATHEGPCSDNRSAAHADFLKSAAGGLVRLAAGAAFTQQILDKKSWFRKKFLPLIKGRHARRLLFLAPVIGALLVDWGLARLTVGRSVMRLARDGALAVRDAL